MKVRTKKFWLVNLAALALGAYLVSLTINALVTHEIRDSALEGNTPALSSRPSDERAEVKSYQLIAERNLFHSAKKGPRQTPLSAKDREFLLRYEPHLNRDTIQKVFSAGQAFSASQEESVQLVIYCHIVEGRYCHFIPTQQGPEDGGTIADEPLTGKHPLAKDLALEITQEIGPKHLEHAHKNGARIRLAKTKETQNIKRCSIDWGWGEGWQDLKVR